MNIWLGLYLIGCLGAFIISIIELIKTHDADDTEKQYGLIPVVILLSWMAIIAWICGHFCNSKSNNKTNIENE